MHRPLRALLIVASAYVAAQMVSNIASLRIISLVGFAVDAGTLIYPFTFTLRDLVHKIAGRHAARVVIVTAASINLAMAATFWLVARLPADAATGAQLQFGNVLSPVWRLVFASIAAQVISELTDTEVYQAWVNRMGARSQWGRVLVSNSASIPVDSAVFVVGAFAGVLSSGVVWQVFWVNVAFKWAVTLVSIPWIYWVHPAPLAPDVESFSSVSP